MILNGKFKEDFLNYCVNNKEKLFNRLLSDEVDVLDEIYYFNPIMLNALIIEFFDSVGIIIRPSATVYSEVVYFDFDIIYKKEIYRSDYSVQSRQQATEKAIEKANEIYNK